MMIKIPSERATLVTPRMGKRATRSPIRKTRRNRRRTRSKRKSLITASVLKRARADLTELPIAIELLTKRETVISENRP